MKSITMASVLLSLSLLGNGVAFAQTSVQVRKPTRMPSQAAPSALPTNTNTNANSGEFMIDQGIDKLLVTLDYNSWFEKLTVVPASGPKQESQALFYGYGLGVEKNWYHSKWGWGIGAGALTGRAIGGDKSGMLNYFQPRVAWWAVRATPRIFYRWNPQADFGMDLVGMYKQSKWPDPTGDSIVKSGSDMLAGVFFDVRLRFNKRFEAIQSVGVLYKDESTYWRIGLGYRL
jgi:hypothetical protein